jgi:D-alanine-D-alanine ligase
MKTDEFRALNITVLAGGLSPERDVSLSSGALISNALMEAGHNVMLIDAYEGLDGPGAESRFYAKADGKAFSFTVPSAEPDLAALKARYGNRRELIGTGVLEACKKADVVFIGLHGDIGENGQIQSFLDIEGIPYTGTGYVGCLLAMDKDISKRLFQAAGIPTAEWITLTDTSRPVSSYAEEVASAVGFPCVVKPRGCGSSVGVSMVDGPEALVEALDSARRYEAAVLVERKIAGREFSIGVLEGQALPPIEIIPKQGFYDYANKYQAGKTEEICPASLSPEETKRVQELALAVHGALRLGSYSRVDFILDAAGTFWCLEANTLPGMTPTSLLPQEARAAGISYRQLCDRIVRAPVN